MSEHNKKDWSKVAADSDLSYQLRYIADGGASSQDKYLYESGSAAMDIFENNSFVFVEMDLAGVDPKTLSVVVDRDKLSIEGVKAESVQHESEVVFHCAERNFGAFRRVFGLGSTIDSKNIEARYKNGVLVLKLPKMQDRRKMLHHIKVQVDD